MRQRADQVLDAFFSDDSSAPHEVFDNILGAGQEIQSGFEVHDYMPTSALMVHFRTVRKVVANITGSTFTLALTPDDGRIIYEKPNPTTTA